MQVKEIEAGKKACVLFDCGIATVYYPKPGDEDKPDATCNHMDLDFDDECEESAVMEAAVLLDIPETEIERAYG